MSTLRQKISVIVPLYHGERYLNGLKKMICEAANEANEKATVEWVLSNDAPDERINDINCGEQLDVIVLNSDENCGIQGARVKGLDASSGEFILFLDQDDIISPEYFIKQLEYIGDADAVVCDAINDGQPMYPSADRTTLEEGVTKEFNLSVACGFYPGQVLIRKSSIPEIWKQNWLSWNSCDDYYLWLCMFAQGCRFQINPNVLYEHTISGRNQGNNGYVWYMSTNEMLDIILKHHIFTGEEEEKLTKSVQTTVGSVLQDKNWLQKKYSLLNFLVRLYEEDITIEDSIGRMRGGIAIYGYKLGIHIGRFLLKKGVPVECYIDRNAGYFNSDTPVYKKEDIPDSVKVVVNTLVKDDDIVREYINSHYPEIQVINGLDFLDALCVEDR